jgi:hypothetical protein
MAAIQPHDLLPVHTHTHTHTFLYINHAPIDLRACNSSARVARPNSESSSSPDATRPACDHMGGCVAAHNVVCEHTQAPLGPWALNGHSRLCALESQPFLSTWRYHASIAVVCAESCENQQIPLRSPQTKLTQLLGVQRRLRLSMPACNTAVLVA